MPTNTLDALLPILPILIDIGEREILDRIGRTGQTREQVLADAEAKWDAAIKGADDLAKLGHEEE